MSRQNDPSDAASVCLLPLVYGFRTYSPLWVDSDTLLLPYHLPHRPVTSFWAFEVRYLQSDLVDGSLSNCFYLLLLSLESECFTIFELLRHPLIVTHDLPACIKSFLTIYIRALDRALRHAIQFLPGIPTPAPGRIQYMISTRPD